MKTRLFACVVALSFTIPVAAQDPAWFLEDTIDLSALFPTTGAVTALAYVPATGNLVVQVEAPGGEFAELTTGGALVGTFSPTGINLDNAGLAADPTGDLLHVNGLASTSPESIRAFTTAGSLLSTTPSDVAEGCALARDPVSGDLFVYDSTGRRLRRLELSGGTYTSVISPILPASTFSPFADAGLAWNPVTDRLAAAGEDAADDGVIFDMNLDGTIVGPLFDTGITAGICGLDFDATGNRMFVLTRLAGEFVHVYRRSGWTDLGGGSPGIAGVPVLNGVGTLVGGTPAGVSLLNAPPNAAMVAWVSFAPAPFPALGGTVHAFPFANQFFFFANISGAFGANVTWPTGLPSGLQATFQFIVQDASVPDGLTLSNGVLATTP